MQSCGPRQIIKPLTPAIAIDCVGRAPHGCQVAPTPVILCSPSPI